MTALGEVFRPVARREVEHVPLSSVARIVSGGTPKTRESSFWNGGIPWVTPKDLSGLDSVEIHSTPRLITEAGLRNSSAELLPENSVLFSSRAPIGLLAINTIPMATNQGFKSFVPDPKRLDSRYLFRWLEANRPKLQDMGVGATFKEVSKAIVSRLVIPLPPSLDEQQRIAAILDKADELRRKRRQALAHLDVLTRSLFHEMVGDPVSNSRGWPQQKLNTLGRITTGNTPSRTVPENFGDYIEWVKTDNINTPETTVTGARECLSERGAQKARIVPPGSVLVTCIAGSPGVIGNVALVDRTVAFNQQINAFTPNSGPGLYWYALLKSMKPLVQNASSGGMKGLVSKSALSAIDIIVVPEAHQTRFAECLASVERLKAYHGGQLVKIDALFASLQHRAFSGDL
ncbi:restriction endonuclease subunit S [Arthrobacter sp. TMT4-20]